MLSGLYSDLLFSQPIFPTILLLHQEPRSVFVFALSASLVVRVSSLNLSSPGYDPVKLGHVLQRRGCWLTIQPAVLISCSGHLLGGVPFWSGSSRTDDLPESCPEMPRATWKLRLDSSRGLCSHSRLSAIPSLEGRSHSWPESLSEMFSHSSPTETLYIFLAVYIYFLVTCFQISAYTSLKFCSTFSLPNILQEI